MGDDPILFLSFNNVLVAMLFESADKVVGDQLSRPAFNLVTLDELHELAIL